MKFVSSEVRRARPLLGTFVDITAQGTGEAELHRAIDRAFAAIERVHRLMSFHDAQSDVSRINRSGFPTGAVVHPWTWQVLKAAQQFARDSDGVFDITVGSLLSETNYLPRTGHRPTCRATWRDIFFGENCVVFCRRPLIVDLGGIAKGFAVDRAVKALRRAGVTSGVVNAGGDLRVFGSSARKVHLRSAISPAVLSEALRLRNRSIATSATYFEPGALMDARDAASRIPSA